MNTPFTDRSLTFLDVTKSKPLAVVPIETARALERIAGELFKAFNNSCLCPTCRQARKDALARWQAMKDEATK